MIKEQKLLIVNSVSEVNDYLENGWEIISVTPQHLSPNPITSFGYFAIVIQKQK